nr:helix-turn-helix domain-containing protein [uncultured Actinotalea sp.]
MSTQYNVRVELDTREDIDAQLLDAFAPYHPATGRGPRGHVEVHLTVPAEDFVQLMQTTVAITARAVGAPVLAVEMLPTAEFDRRLGLEPVPELLSVTEAARLLGVSRQAVLQRVESGSLPATRVGNAWAIQRAAVESTVRASAALSSLQAEVDQMEDPAPFDPS